MLVLRILNYKQYNLFESVSMPPTLWANVLLSRTVTLKMTHFYMIGLNTHPDELSLREGSNRPTFKYY